MIQKIIIVALAFLMACSVGLNIYAVPKAKWSLYYQGMAEQAELKLAKAELHYEYMLLVYDEKYMAEIRQLKQYLEDQRQALDEAKALQAELRKQLEDVWGREGLRDFESRDAILTFLLEDDTDKLPYNLPEFVCSDYVFLLSRNAAQQGYRLYPVWVYLMYGHGEIKSVHLMAMAIAPTYINEELGIQKAMYLIESQNDELWWAGLLHDPATWTFQLYPFLP